MLAEEETCAGPGDTNFNSSNVGLAQIVNQRATSTAVLVTTGPNPSTYGQSLTFTATVTGTGTGAPNPSGGSVQFKVDGADAGSVSLSGNTATFTTSALTAGSHNITATYLGSANFAVSAESTAVSQTVNKADTTTAILSIAPEPSVVGQPYTVNVSLSVKAPGSGTPSGSITVSGDGSCTITLPATSCSLTGMSAGAKTITAAYGGDSNFNGSPSAGMAHTVNKADTATALTSSANPSVYGQSVTFTATVTVVAPGAGTATGTVTFKDGTTTLGTGTLTGGVATFTTSALSVASHSITACYGSDGNFKASISAALTQVVNKANTTTALTSSVNPSVYGQSVTFTATVSAVAPGAGTATGTVTFKDGTTVLGTGTLSGGVATFTTSALSVASHSITACYGSDGNFNASVSAALTQVVNKADTTTALTSSVNPSIYGQSVTFTATVATVAPGVGTPTGSVQFSVDGTNYGSPVALSGATASFSVSLLAPGGHTITAAYSGDGNFNISSGNVMQMVSQAAPTVTDTAPSSSTFGQSVTLSVTVAPPFCAHCQSARA